MSVARRVLRSLEEHGWNARLVRSDRRLDLWRELQGRLQRGEVDEEVFKRYLQGFGEAIRGAPDWIRSLLIVAAPDPAMRIRFGWRGREIAVTVPPTYVHWRDRVDGEIERVLREELGGTEHRIAPASVPKKLLAARSGLAQYGRNNITYVEGLGSYHRLVAMYTTLPADADHWREPDTMAACRSCRLCSESCPAGAIDEERFLLRAERCLTFWNEKPADVPFPEWIDPSCHNQLVGCMRCQAVCPQNRGFLSAVEAGDPFTEEETRALLEGATIDELPDETVVKLRIHGVLEYLEVLPRNLGVLLNSSTTR